MFGATGGPSRGVTSHFFPHPPFSTGEVKTDLYPGKWKKKVWQSNAGIAAMAGVLALWASKAGVGQVAALYGGPLLVVNAWLVLITWLQHTDVDVPHFDSENWSFIKGALHTIDRPYGKVLDFLHHRIGSTHVAHHVSLHSLYCSTSHPFLFRLPILERMVTNTVGNERRHPLEEFVGNSDRCTARSRRTTNALLQARDFSCGDLCPLHFRRRCKASLRSAHDYLFIMRRIRAFVPQLQAKKAHERFFLTFSADDTVKNTGGLHHPSLSRIRGDECDQGGFPAALPVRPDPPASGDVETRVTVRRRREAW